MLKWGETRLPKLGVNMGKCGKSPLRGYWLYMVITCFGTSGGPNMDALPLRRFYFYQDQQNAHSRWSFSFFSRSLMFENNALCCSKVMLTNTGKWRNSQCDWMERQTLKKSVNPAHKNMWQGIFPATIFSFHFFISVMSPPWLLLSL